MNSIVRNFVVPACVVALGAGAIIWNLVRIRATERKYAEHLKQYRAGADRGDADAEYKLAFMYFWGRGVPQDYAQSNYWCQKAADQGLAKAKYEVGNSYFYGTGVAQSYSEALIWYREAAEQGNAYAQYAIGSMYYHGFGVPQSYTDALPWYRKAADQGYAQAESGIGYLYWSGLGVQKDREEANRWYRRAASHGDEDAQRWLGLRVPPCGRAFGFAPLVGLVGALFFLVEFFRQGGDLREPRLRRTVVLSLISLLWSVMDWFQYSKYGLFPNVWTAQSFHIVASFLGGAMVAILVPVVWPKGDMAVLIFSGLSLAAVDLVLLMKVHFDLTILSAFYWRIVALDSAPIGMAVVAAIRLRRRKNERADGTPPAQPAEAPHAV